MTIFRIFRSRTLTIFHSWPCNPYDHRCDQRTECIPDADPYVCPCPIMMISALVMCVSISPKISLIFLIALVFLGGVMAFIVSHAFPIFDKMFKGYDKLNASVQENLTGIRVVKAYVREDHENKKFCDATDNLKKMSVHAERLVIMNQPVMQFTVYTCILLISWIGAR